MKKRWFFMALILFMFSEIATAQSEENVEPPKNVVYFKAGHHLFITR